MDNVKTSCMLDSIYLQSFWLISNGKHFKTRLFALKIKHLSSRLYFKALRNKYDGSHNKDLFELAQKLVTSLTLRPNCYDALHALMLHRAINELTYPENFVGEESLAFEDAYID